MRCGAFGEIMVRLTASNYRLLTQTEQLDIQYTGTGLNVLAGLVQCKDEGRMLTCLPNHHVGQAAAAKIRHLGIDDRAVLFQGDHIGIYFLEQGFGQRPSQVTYLDRSQSSFCQAEYRDSYFAAALDGLDAIHFCGISLAISKQLSAQVLRLAKMAKQKGIKIIFDCNYRASLWQDKNPEDALAIYREMMQLADIAFVSVKDCPHLGISPKNLSEIEVLQKIKDDFGLKILFGTRREANQYIGYLLDDKGYLESKPYPLEVLDRIGAGDAFASGAIHGYFHQVKREELIDFAAASGALAHTTYGDSPQLSKHEIDQYRLYGRQDLIR